MLLLLLLQHHETVVVVEKLLLLLLLLLPLLLLLLLPSQHIRCLACVPLLQKYLVAVCWFRSEGFYFCCRGWPSIKSVQEKRNKTKQCEKDLPAILMDEDQDRSSMASFLPSAQKNQIFCELFSDVKIYQNFLMAIATFWKVAFLYSFYLRCKGLFDGFSFLWC